MVENLKWQIVLFYSESVAFYKKLLLLLIFNRFICQISIHVYSVFNYTLTTLLLNSGNFTKLCIDLLIHSLSVIIKLFYDKQHMSINVNFVNIGLILTFIEVPKEIFNN